MESVLAGNFDAVKYKTEYGVRYSASQQQINGMREGFETVKKAATCCNKARDVKAAIDMQEKALALTKKEQGDDKYENRVLFHNY